MPFVRLIIFLFRGVGRIFSAFVRLLKALVGAGMRSFLVKSFEALLRLGFIGSLVAVVVVCWNLVGDKPYASTDGYASVGPDIWYEIDASSFSRSQRLTPSAIFRDFHPKDDAVAYQPGILSVAQLVDTWNEKEMLPKPDRLVTRSPRSRRETKSGSWPKLRETDFAPDNWTPFRQFFEQSWAIITLPLVLAWLVFPGSVRMRDRIHRACLFAPLCAFAGFSFAYLLSRHWLNSQYDILAELFTDLPRWSHPVGVLNQSMLTGLFLSLIPLALWYLLRWVVGPFLNQSPARPAP